MTTKLLVYAFVLIVLQECMRRSGKWIPWGAFVVLPVALTPFWAESSDADLFPWVKLYTSCFNVAWLVALRFTRLGGHRWALLASYLVLGANILEAVFLDMLGDHYCHTLQVISGVLLIVVLPWRLEAIRIDVVGPQRDLHCLAYTIGMTRFWIAAYTAWNWTFLYSNYPAIAGQHIAVLGSAFALGMIDPRKWLQTRTFTLAIAFLLQFTFPTFMSRYMDTSQWNSPLREDIGALTSLFIILCLFICWYLRRFVKTNASIA